MTQNLFVTLYMFYSLYTHKKKIPFTMVNHQYQTIQHTTSENHWFKVSCPLKQIFLIYPKYACNADELVNKTPTTMVYKWRFPKSQGTPSHHPFGRIFHEANHPAMGVAHDYGDLHSAIRNTIQTPYINHYKTPHVCLYTIGIFNISIFFNIPCLV